MQLTNKDCNVTNLFPQSVEKLKLDRTGIFPHLLSLVGVPDRVSSLFCVPDRYDVPNFAAGCLVRRLILPIKSRLEVLMDPRSFPFNKLTPEDHLTIRKWKWGVGAVCGAALLVLALIVAAGPYTKTETASIEHGFSATTIADPHTNRTGSSGYSYRERK